MTTFNTLASNDLNTSSDEFLLSQGGIQYRQSREALAASISNGRWSADFDYLIGSETIGSDNEKYVAVANTGNSYGNATDPTTDSGTIWLMQDRSGKAGGNRADEVVSLLLQDSNASIYPSVEGSYAEAGGTYTEVPSNTTHLVVNDGTDTFIVEMSSEVSGTISALDPSALTATIGGTSITLARLDLSTLLASKNNFGIDQSWQNVTSSRSNNVVYTNNTGSPIQISVSCNLSTSGNIYFRLGSSNDILARFEGVNGGFCLTPIIPAGGTYRFTTSGTIISWWELR